jgi:hypothetical protein
MTKYKQDDEEILNESCREIEGMRAKPSGKSRNNRQPASRNSVEEISVIVCNEGEEEIEILDNGINGDGVSV